MSGTVHFDIQVQPADKIVMSMTALGLRPYVNTEIEMDEDENVTFIVRAGGGVTTDAEAVTEELAEFFDGLATYLRAGTVTVESNAADAVNEDTTDPATEG